MYKAYRPFTPSIHNVSSVIYGPMYTPNVLHEVYVLYRAYAQRTKRTGLVHQVYTMYHRLYMVQCIHQIVHTKYTPCTGRLHDVYPMYKAYRPFTLSIHNVSSVIYGPMYTPNCAHKVYALYNFVHEVYDLYRPFTPRIPNVQSV